MFYACPDLKDLLGPKYKEMVIEEDRENLKLEEIEKKWKYEREVMDINDNKSFYFNFYLEILRLLS